MDNSRLYPVSRSWGGENRLRNNRYVDTLDYRYLKVDYLFKLLINQSKFSGPRKFTLRYQLFEIKGIEILIIMKTFPNYRLLLEVEVHFKLLTNQSKFSGPRKFTLRYQ